MSYNNNLPRAEYTATSGQTIFPYLFKIYADTDVTVYQNGSLVATVEYTVAITGDAGGSVTLNTGATVDDAIVLLRALPQTRTTEYQSNGDLRSSTLNDDQDYQTYLMMDLQGGMDVLEADIAAIDSNVVTNIDNILVVAGINTEITTVATNIADVNTVASNIASVNATATNVVDVNTVASNIGSVELVGRDLSNEWEYIEDNGSISDVVTGGTGTSSISTVADSIASVNTTALSILDINSVATTVVPNIAEILLADDNAVIATQKASDASTSEVASALSASNASTSEGNANTYKLAAEAAQDAAEAALDSFDDRYLGAKAVDPTLDNDGNALAVGSLYFNTTTDVMKVYEGSGWVAAYASLSGALLTTNNLSDLSNPIDARTNLGVDVAGTINYVHPTTVGNQHLPANVSQTEAGYLDGVTSNIQAQFDSDIDLGSIV